MNMNRLSKIVASVFKYAINFPSTDALNTYMHDHPDGDRRNHRVVAPRTENKKVEVKNPIHNVVKEEVHNHLKNVAVYTKKNGWQTRDGKPVPDHVKSRSVPPAWKNVRFDPNPKAELVVQGYDKKGRLQSKYSDSYKVKAAAVKFARIDELLKKKSAIVKENDQNLKDKSKTENAACLRLIMDTGIRPGSDKDTKAEKHAYGATTLKGEHVVQEKDGIHLKFVGKKGVSLDIQVQDKTIVDDLKKRARQVGKNGVLFQTTGANLLGYTHTLDGGKFKTKDMRTMVGTSVAIQEIKKMSAPDSEKDFIQKVRAVAEVVSKRLGNTPIVALQSYISPVVFAPWRKVEWSDHKGKSV
jgi:DNA topoisomerase I